MEFDDIKDNMIVQDKGKRYVMVIECQGVNFDLMSEVEKVAVEEGFQQFLNTLRHPIQLYIQTRTVNLESSIERYKEQIRQIEDRYRNREYNLRKAKEETDDEKLIKRLEKELAREKNLLEYGRDIVKTTERMSKNKNILNKKYYVVISYNIDELYEENYDETERKDLVFNELYNRAQAIIRTLSISSVNSRILNSLELAELLYMAYNRDEAEVYNIQKVIESGLLELYSTGEDVYRKKIQALDKHIQEEAINLANENIQKARSNLEQRAIEKEKEQEKLIKEMAKIILEQNEEYIGVEVAEEAKKEVQKLIDEKDKPTDEENKPKRGRKKKTTK